jgi:hypothetical protein
MYFMSRKTLFLALGLLLSLILLASLVDLFGPNTPPASTNVLPHLLRRSFSIHIFEPLSGDRPPPPRFGHDLPRTSLALAGAASLIGYGLILWYCVPQRANNLIDKLAMNPKQALRLGFIGLALSIFLIALTILAAISLIGLPLVPFFSLASGLLQITAVVGFATAIGQQLRRLIGDPIEHRISDLIVGVLALMLLATIPWVGILILQIACLLGIGALISTRFGEQSPHQLDLFKR